jgi:hypothetical protein
MNRVMQGQGRGFSDSATQMGSGLEVANAIRDYLNRAGGDARLALAMSVADALTSAQARAAERDPKLRSREDMH